MTEWLHLGFMQNALAAGILLSIVLAVVSCFVVLRRFSFIGVGVAHSAFGGVALGALIGVSPTLSAIVFAVCVANAIGIVGNQQRLSADTAIGIFFSLAMALGVIFIGLSNAYNVDLFGYLFGNILAITHQDILVIAILGSLVLASIWLFFKELLFVAFDSEVAHVSGIPVMFLDHFFSDDPGPDRGHQHESGRHHPGVRPSGHSGRRGRPDHRSIRPHVRGCHRRGACRNHGRPLHFLLCGSGLRRHHRHPGLPDFFYILRHRKRDEEK
jgi:hypothetical protein